MIKNCDSLKKSDMPSLVDLFHKGDLVRCKVLSFTNNKLNLTIEPDEVNNNLTYASLEDNMVLSGTVKSKEDHGYTIDIGISELSGFFKVKNFNLPLGQVKLFRIISKKSKRAISLKICDSNESSFYILESKFKFDNYLPGAQLDCTIEKTSKNGIHLNISNDLYGYVHINHIPTSKRSSLVKKKDSEEKKFFNQGETVSGTIIFINPYSKIIYMSLLPHLIDSTKVSKIAHFFLKEDGLRLGNIIENAIVHSHTHKGLFLKFSSSDSKQILGFVPKKHLFEKNDKIGEDEVDDDEDASDEKLKKLKKDAKNLSREDLEQSFPLNSSVRARIFDYSLIEDIIMLSCRQSVLDSKYLTFNELSVGQTVNATVRKINTQNGGVLVKLSDFITGFIPKIHTGDIPLSESMINKKMTIGSEIKCKIMQLKPEEKKCVLTAKKSLIKSKLSLIDSYDNLNLGLETYGVVISIQKYGLLLQFLNEVKGLLPRQEISTSLKPEEDLHDLYYVGQLIKCKVLDFNKEKQNIKLSLLMDDVPKKKIVSVELENEYEIGDLIETGTIIQVGKEDSYFRVKLPKGNKNGIIFKDHLSDLDCLNDVLFDYYKKEMKIKNFMVIQHGDTSKFKKIDGQKSLACHHLTLKTTIIDFYLNSKHKIAKCFEDLKANEHYHGWIKKILPNGLLIQLPYGLDGFCSNEQFKYLDEMKSSNINGLKTGQSILVKISHTYQDKKRFTTITKTRYDLSIKKSIEMEFMLQYFQSFLTNSKFICDFLCTNESNRPFWNKAFKMVKIGSNVQVAVKNFNKSSRQIECLFIEDLESNNFDQNSLIVGYAFADLDEEYNEGQRLEALVVAFDPFSRAFCLIVNKKAVKTYAKNFDTKYRAQIICKKEQRIKAEVLYVSNWFCILGLKAHALGRIAFMPLFKNNFTQLNTARAMNDRVQILNTNDLVDKNIRQKQVRDVSGNALAAITEAQDTKKSASQFSYFSTGELIQCIIKTDNDQDYILAIHDLENSKRNKKKILREIAILNENHLESDNNRKRKLDEEPIIVKKKLLIDKKKNLEDQENEKDHIEVVASVKGPALVDSKVNVDKGESVFFPWEVTDFDQFNEIISKVSNQNSTKDEPKKKEKPTTKEKTVDDRLIYEKEEEVFDPNREPDNADDFERLIASKPNNSFVWIKYIVFYLQMAEIEKARAVAKQALKTILYTEDQERLNVWVALLNLENMYGTQTSLEQAFNQACQNCDSYKIHCHMAEIFARSNKIQEAEAIFIKMTRKFSQSPEVWIKYGIFHYKNSNCELARKLLIKSFNSLDKKDRKYSKLYSKKFIKLFLYIF